MKITLIKNEKKLQEGLRSLTKEFIHKHSYYTSWIQKNSKSFENGTRVVYEMSEEKNVVGYMMVHFLSNQCAKLNGIYVFPKYQRRGYAEAAIQELLNKLKNKGYKYAYVQTRPYNAVMLHVFDVMQFHVLGKKYHEIEKMDNVIAGFDLQERKDISEMRRIAKEIYSNFTPLTSKKDLV